MSNLEKSKFNYFAQKVGDAISVTDNQTIVTELVAEAAATVTEANGFDSDEQAAQACRLRPFAIGCGNGRAWCVWVNESATGDPMWVRWQNEGAPNSTYVPFQNTDDYVYTPVDQRDEYVGD